MERAGTKATLIRSAGIVGLVLLAAFAAGCRSKTQVAEEKVLIEKAMKCEVEFLVNKVQIDALWGKAQVLISEYGEMKLQIVTDYVLETYNPTDRYLTGFRVTKTPEGEAFHIKVVGTYCAGDYGLWAKQGKKRADIFAHALACRLQEELSSSEAFPKQPVTVTTTEPTQVVPEK